MPKINEMVEVTEAAAAFVAAVRKAFPNSTGKHVDQVCSVALAMALIEAETES